MTNLTKRKEELLDWSNLVLAVALFLAPWLLGFADATASAWNAWLSAAVIAGLALAAIQAFAEWEEWGSLLLGAWVVVSPWLLGFAGIAAALWTHIVVGGLVVAVTAWRLWLMHRTPPRVAA
ncbi:SPW repeat protein [Rhodospirillaceae bacterium SYSU D60014]|uniref:SPW repeat protein n=1 Tax=Virgifigura deserti TaxID=2268457 RepID=UPI000E665B0E